MNSEQLITACDNTYTPKERRKDLSSDIRHLKATVRVTSLLLILCMAIIIVGLHFSLSSISSKCSENERRYQNIQQKIDGLQHSIEWNQ